MEELEQLLRDWDENAQLDPLWAICSTPGKRYNSWKIKEFFQTGEQQIQHALTLIENSGLTLKKGRALDFGCGVGRLTQALVQEFEIGYGIDISPTMIEYAQKFNRFGERCQYLVNTQDNLHIFQDNFFDFIYSFIVLQHMPPRLMTKYIQEFVRILNKGGVLMFQVPVQLLTPDINPFQRLPLYHPARIKNKLQWEIKQILEKIFGDKDIRFYRLSKLGIPKRWLYQKLGVQPPVHMYYCDEQVITDLVAQGGATVIDVIKDTEQEPGMLNAQFVVIK